MVASPRIITVDPTGTIAFIVRAVADLLDISLTVIDMTGGQEALAEVRRGGCTLLITTVELGDKIRGYQLAIEVSQIAPETRVIVLAESTDPELDAKEMIDSPYVYMHRPVNLQRFSRVIYAALNGGDIFQAAQESLSASAQADLDLGHLPFLDVEVARPIIDTLLTDVGAMAIVFANRLGEVLLERGAVGYLDRERLTNALQPIFRTTIDMGDLVGGNSRTLHFFDGEDYDVFVISVGLHHFLCLAFNGEAGNRAFGAVNRFGRRAAEDLVQLLGAAAFVIEARTETTARKPHPVPQDEENEEIFQPLERAGSTYEEPEPIHLDPIEELDFSIFETLDNLDLADADELFDPEKLADLVEQTNRKGGTIDIDEAGQLGIMPRLND